MEKERALVTGASGGIGEETAKLLAGRGRDVLLVSRSGEKLRRLAEAISATSPVRAEVLALDLASPSAPGQIASFLAERNLEIDILVNNAGYGTFGAFSETDLANDLGQIQLNVATLTHLTKLLLPGMIRRGRGRILNVASTAAFQAGPLMAVYYATKAYVLSFSEALANELRGTGVTVTCLCPGPTRTGFNERAGIARAGVLTKKGVMMDAATVARRGVDALLKGKRLVIPGFMNRFLAHSTRLSPRALAASIVRGLLEGTRPPSK